MHKQKMRTHSLKRMVQWQRSIFENFIASPVSLDLGSSGFCSAAGIRCNDTGLSPCSNKPYRRRLLDAELDGALVCDPVRSIQVVNTRRFFHLSEFTPGSLFTFPAFYNAPATRFLAHPLAAKISLDPQELPVTMATLHIVNAPVMKLFMVSTLSACAHAPSSIETKRCTPSLRELSSFVSVALNTTSPVVRGSKGTSHMDQLLANKQVQVRKLAEIVPVSKPHVACHRMAYPFMLHYCHMVQGTHVFSVTIATHHDDEVEYLLECHTITKYMKPGNAILNQLGLKPGEGEFCHLVESSALIFTN
ncbi:BURP domain-containing protein 5 [Selaginella moellendorffii]|nr:BURP domain-containing protein 5 [Selaginella moellendorffii]|eukprot:XP_002962118.2 BURP domain-containing protein 5 [Selaginella moellendorffii]